MAPKRKSVVGTVVKRTRRVVKETVQVAVMDDDEKIIEEAGDEIEREEIIESRGRIQKPVKTIVVEDKTPEAGRRSQARDESETQEIPSSDQKQTETQEAGKEKTCLKKERKKRRGRRGEGYKIYLFRVLKQVHPGMEISSKAMTVLNNLMSDVFEQLVEEATKLSKYTRKKTMSSLEIQGAVKLVLPGDLGKHAIAEGAKAVSTFMA